MSSRLLIVFAPLLLVTVYAFGQSTEILTTGPDKGSGVPYLQPNVIPYYTVTYHSAPLQSASPVSQSATSGASGIRVLFAAAEVVAYSEWKPAPCGLLSTLRVRDSPPVLYYKGSQGWSLFFAFSPSSPSSPSSSSAKARCSFVSTFIERFNYFLGITQNSAISSFPAVLTLP